MSEDDVLRARGKAQQDYVDCRSRLSALESEARHAAQHLEEAAKFLRGTRQTERFATGGLEEYLAGKLITLMADLHDTRERLKILRQTLVDMGLDLKD